MKKVILLSFICLVGLFSACSLGGPANTGNLNSSTEIFDESVAPPIPVWLFDTAFAHGNYVFASDPAANPEQLPSLNLTKNRWGWALNIVPKSETTNFIYYGAALNDLTKGILVGTLIVNKYCDKAKFRISLLPQFRMTEVHIYAGDSKPITIAPGLYGFTKTFPKPRTAYSVVLPVIDTDGDGIWTIVHLVVGIPQL